MKVKVKSLVNGTVGVKDVDLRINRTWNKKGCQNRGHHPVSKTENA